jgi:eukaryotic-like serine/threonine-protein kinase
MTELSYGSCRVTGTIGQGPLTVVYRAVQEPLGRTVAIKALRGTISPSSPLAAQLEREAHLLAQLQHEGIPELYDFVRTEETMWLVLEHVDGTSLSALLERSARGIGTAAALSIGADVADALAHAHARGIVHRDVKPANILLSREGAAKLADFGIAHDDRLPSMPEPVEGTGGFGTPAYMSPEQVLGEDVDARSDLFSLGIVLYHMIAGVRPFEAPDVRATTQRIRHEAPAALSSVVPGVPHSVERIVERCLEKAPDHRFPSAVALAEALRRAALDLELVATRREVAGSLLRAGLVTELPPSAAEIVPPRDRPEPVRDGIGAAAIGQLVTLLAMVLGGSAIQSNLPAESVDRGSDVLELVPERAASLRVVARPWATVFVDGHRVDVTPFARAIPLRAGEHDVLLRHPVAPDENRVLKLSPGESALLEVEMKVPAQPVVATASAAPTSSTP